MKEKYEKPIIEIIEFRIEEETCCTSGSVVYPYPPFPYGADSADY